MGTFSGVTCVVVGHPLDTIKVRLRLRVRASFATCFRELPLLMAVTPAWMGVFLTHGAALKWVGSDDLNSVAVAGAISRRVQCGMCPFEMVKVNAAGSQRQPGRQLAPSGHAGARGLYRGFGACLLRDMSQSAVYYYCAESLNRSRYMNDTFGSSTPFVAGAITGIAHVSMEFPFDTIKSRFQTNIILSSYRQCLLELAHPQQLRTAGAVSSQHLCGRYLPTGALSSQKLGHVIS